MAASNTAYIDAAAPDLVINRLVKAPPELVFAAFTDPAHIGNWWGPRGFTTTTKSMDLRPGGAWIHVMHGPDGTDYDNYVEYLEVDPPHRLVYRNASGVHADDAFITTIALEPEANATRVSFRMHFPSVEARAAVLEFGAFQGAIDTLDRLEEQLATQADEHELVITRVFDAPRSLVWKTYTQPEHLKRWWGPKDWTLPVCEVDLRVGGTWLYCMRGPDGTEAWGKATYREIVEPELLVYIDSFVDAEGNPVPGMPQLPVVIEFAEENGRTAVTFRTTFISAAEKESIVEMGMLVGMNMSLDKLETHLASLS